jgi:hypothetical protein
MLAAELVSFDLRTHEISVCSTIDLTCRESFASVVTRQ